MKLTDLELCKRIAEVEGFTEMKGIVFTGY